MSNSVEDGVKQPPEATTETSNPKANLLDIPHELRETIYEYVLPNQKALYKLPFFDETTTNYIQLVSKISSRLQKIDIALLTVNKQIYFEALPTLQKTNNFHVHRFAQLRRAVFGSPSGLSDQFRHITVHGDTVCGDTRGINGVTNYLINISDWQNLRYLCLAASDFHNMLSETAMLETAKICSTPNSLNPLTIAAEIKDGVKNTACLIAQLLSFNDGCLRIQGSVFYDTFQVFGRKGRITAEMVHEFITKLQPECAAAAKSGKCFHKPVEVMVGEVRVEIGYTMTGITTARIL
jgi:hypothetical protein